MGRICDVVFKDSRDVFLLRIASVFLAPLVAEELMATHLREIALAVADEQTCLAATSITDNNNLLGVCGRLCDMSARGLAAR